MTPKDKALELFHQYKIFCSSTENRSWKENARQATLIAVDEILHLKMIFAMGRGDILSEGEFWLKVKEEINNL